MLKESRFRTNPKPREGLVTRVTPVKATDRGRIIELFARALADDPMMRWIYPTSQQFIEYFPNFVRIVGGKAFELNTVWQVGGFRAASLWLPPGAGHSEVLLESLIANTVNARIRAEVHRAFAESRRFRPSEAHWYLPMIGTDPSVRGLGFGSLLIRHALNRCETESVPTHLETSNPRAVAFYRRFGFRTLGIAQIGSSPAVFSMRRYPNGESRSTNPGILASPELPAVSHYELSTTL